MNSSKLSKNNRKSDDFNAERVVTADNDQRTRSIYPALKVREIYRKNEYIGSAGQEIERNWRVIKLSGNQKNNAEIKQSHPVSSLSVEQPFFFQTRSQMNTTPSAPREKWTYKIPERVDCELTLKNFPKRMERNYVKAHSEGFTNKENFDFFTHLYRLFLGNKFVLMRNMKEAEDISNKRYYTVWPKIPQNEFDIQYIPLQLKQFMLIHDYENIKLYKNIIKLYKDNLLGTAEEKILDELEEQDQEKGIEANNQNEEKYLKQTVDKIKKEGIKSISRQQIKRFSNILKKRISKHAELKSSIESEANCANNYDRQKFQHGKSGSEAQLAKLPLESIAQDHYQNSMLGHKRVNTVMNIGLSPNNYNLSDIEDLRPETDRAKVDTPMNRNILKRYHPNTSTQTSIQCQTPLNRMKQSFNKYTEQNEPILGEENYLMKDSKNFLRRSIIANKAPLINQEYPEARGSIKSPRDLSINEGELPILNLPRTKANLYLRESVNGLSEDKMEMLTRLLKSHRESNKSIFRSIKNEVKAPIIKEKKEKNTESDYLDFKYGLFFKKDSTSANLIDKRIPKEISETPLASITINKNFNDVEQNSEIKEDSGTESLPDVVTPNLSISIKDEVESEREIPDICQKEAPPLEEAAPLEVEIIKTEAKNELDENRHENEARRRLEPENFSKIEKPEKLSKIEKPEKFKKKEEVPIKPGKNEILAPETELSKPIVNNIKSQVPTKNYVEVEIKQNNNKTKTNIEEISKKKSLLAKENENTPQESKIQATAKKVKTLNTGVSLIKVKLKQSNEEKIDAKKESEGDKETAPKQKIKQKKMTSYEIKEEVPKEKKQKKRKYNEEKDLNNEVPPPEKLDNQAKADSIPNNLALDIYDAKEIFKSYENEKKSDEIEERQEKLQSRGNSNSRGSSDSSLHIEGEELLFKSPPKILKKQTRYEKSPSKELKKKLSSNEKKESGPEQFPTQNTNVGTETRPNKITYEFNDYDKIDNQFKPYNDNSEQNSPSKIFNRMKKREATSTKLKQKTIVLIKEEPSTIKLTDLDANLNMPEKLNQVDNNKKSPIRKPKARTKTRVKKKKEVVKKEGSSKDDENNSLTSEEADVEEAEEGEKLDLEEYLEKELMQNGFTTRGNTGTSSNESPRPMKINLNASKSSIGSMIGFEVPKKTIAIFESIATPRLEQGLTNSNTEPSIMTSPNQAKAPTITNAPSFMLKSGKLESSTSTEKMESNSNYQEIPQISKATLLKRASKKAEMIFSHKLNKNLGVISEQVDNLKVMKTPGRNSMVRSETSLFLDPEFEKSINQILPEEIEQQDRYLKKKEEMERFLLLLEQNIENNVQSLANPSDDLKSLFVGKGSLGFEQRRNQGLKFMDKLSMPLNSGASIISSLMEEIKIKNGESIPDSQIEKYLRFLRINEDIEMEAKRKKQFQKEQEELNRIKTHYRIINEKKVIQTELKKSEVMAAMGNQQCKSLINSTPNPSAAKKQSHYTQGNILEGPLSKEFRSISRLRKEDPDQFVDLINKMKKVKLKQELHFMMRK